MLSVIRRVLVNYAIFQLAPVGRIVTYVYQYIMTQDAAKVKQLSPKKSKRKFNFVSAENNVGVIAVSNATEPI